MDLRIEKRPEEILGRKRVGGLEVHFLRETNSSASSHLYRVIAKDSATEDILGDRILKRGKGGFCITSSSAIGKIRLREIGKDGKLVQRVVRLPKKATGLTLVENTNPDLDSILVAHVLNEAAKLGIKSVFMRGGSDGENNLLRTRAETELGGVFNKAKGNIVWQLTGPEETQPWRRHLRQT